MNFTKLSITNEMNDSCYALYSMQNELNRLIMKVATSHRVLQIEEFIGISSAHHIMDDAISRWMA